MVAKMATQDPAAHRRTNYVPVTDKVPEQVREQEHEQEHEQKRQQKHQVEQEEHTLEDPCSPYIDSSAVVLLVMQRQMPVIQKPTENC